MKTIIVTLLFIGYCASYKILAVFPYNGRSHHIFYSSLVEELAARKHDVTVINYFSLKKSPHLHQISLKNNENGSDFVNIEEHLKSNSNNGFIDFFKAYDTAQAFRYIANTNCEKLVNNQDVQTLLNSDVKYDLVIAEQFVTDCGLALAHKLNAPTVGMAAHVLMPWTYSRLGAPNNPSFVPNHFFGSGTQPDLIDRIKGTLINTFFNVYYKYVIQRNDHEIVKRILPETPDLEYLGRNISLILLNQYFPLTGSRLQGANVIEVGGMHIKDQDILSDKALADFMNSAKEGVIYISFGSVAKNFPPSILNEIRTVLQKSTLKFIWKVDEVHNLDVPNNTLLRKWLPQQALLCHPKVVAFITHAGMLSSSEAMHCGVPIVCVPLFGDQFANAASAVESGLGVTVDLQTLTAGILETALGTVLQKEYQNKAKQLSQVWRDRPMTPMDTAIYWIEYVARYNGSVNMKPPLVDLPLYQYLLIDVYGILGSIVTIFVYLLFKLLSLIRQMFLKKQAPRNRKSRKQE